MRAHDSNSRRIFILWLVLGIVAIVLFVTVTIIRLRSENGLTASAEWSIVRNHEYFHDNGWAGAGLYFHEDKDRAYCTAMVYGSGVPVVAYHTSVVSFDEEGRLSIDLPKDFGEVENHEIVMVALAIETWDDHIMLGNQRYEPVDEPWGHKALLEMIDSGWFDEETEE